MPCFNLCRSTSKKDRSDEVTTATVPVPATPTMPVDLYCSYRSGPSRHVLLVAAALNVDINMKPIDLAKGENKTPEYLKLNPQHTIPTMVDDGYVLWESRAITRYLVNKYGGADNPLYPADLKARARVDQRLDFDLGTLHPRFLAYFHPLVFGGTPDESHMKRIEEALGFFNTFLEGQKYAAGDNLTLADLSLVSTMSSIEAGGIDLAPYPNIVTWFELVKSTAPKFHEISDVGIQLTKELFAKIKANQYKL